MVDLRSMFLRAVGRAEPDPVRAARQQVELIPGGPNAPELACRPVDYRPELLPALAEAEVKVDGICSLYISNRLVTLEGQPFNAARHCLPALSAVEEMLGGGFFLHGEYVEDAGFDATVSAFRKGEGTGTIWLHDAIPMEDWIANRPGRPRHVRKAELLKAVLAAGNQFVGALGSFKVTSHADVMRLFQIVTSRGYEGLVVKDRGAAYQRQRSAAWLRLKPLESIDLPLIEIMGSNASGARKLVLRDIAGPVIVTQGLSAEQRKLIWLERDVLTGTDELKPILVEVEHNGRTEKGKLRHPRFKRVRQDRQPLR